MHQWKKYVLWFAQEHVDFRCAEISSILKLWNIEMKLPNDHKSEYPFWIVELPSIDAVRKIASRSVSLRCILELWAHGNSINSMHSNAKKFYLENEKCLANIFSADKSFKITVETYNKHFSQKEKVDKIEGFGYLPIHGSVDLKNPDTHWWYIEFYGMDHNNVPPEPIDVIFGKWITDGQRCLVNEISLKKRKFIGNTSMDPLLSLLMVNQGQVQNGDLVYDPFVGSGSLLVAAAKYGGFVLGSDIDYLMIHGKTRPSRVNQKKRDLDECIYSNLKQYNCEDKFIDILVSDFSNSIWIENLKLDSIITDPPYGIREATEKIEFKNKKKGGDDNSMLVPSTSPYKLCSLYVDLMNFSARHLKMNGRLVCWFPIHKNDYTEDILPRHNCFQLVANSEQVLSALTSRRLLTYEKTKDFDPLEDNQVSGPEFEDFRTKFFDCGEESRHERRLKKAELWELGKQEALKRGKMLDENGKVIPNKNVKP